MKKQLTIIGSSFAIVFITLALISANVEPKKHLIITANATPNTVQVTCDKYYKWGFTLKETIVVSGEISGLQPNSQYSMDYTAFSKATQLLLIFEK